MIKYFGPRGRQRLGLHVALTGLLLLPATWLMLAGPRSSLHWYNGVGVMLQFAAIAILLRIMHLASSRIQLTDLREVVEEMREQHRRAQADAGAIHEKIVLFRDLSTRRKILHLAIVLLGAGFCVVGLLDIIGLLPLRELTVNTARGTKEIVPHWFTGLIGLGAGVLCFYLLWLNKYEVTSDWDESLERLFREFEGPKK